MKKTLFYSLFFFGKLLLLFNASLFSFENQNTSLPKTVVTIKPIYCLVKGLMRGVAKPLLLIPSFQSPHTYQFSIKDRQYIEQADCLVAIGKGLEPFLEKIISQFPAYRVFEITKIPEVYLLDARFGGHSCEEHSSRGEKHTVPLEVPKDPHVWLDPKNAKAFVQRFCDYLCKMDPKDAEQYQQNQQILLEKLSALEQKLKQLLPKKITYICFHDAYAYFDHAFGTERLAIVTNNPEHPSLNPLELQKLHHLSRQEHIKIFTEPQFEGYSLKRLTEQQAFLDPYGIHTSAEQEGYFQMMEEIAISLSQQRET